MGRDEDVAGPQALAVGAVDVELPLAGRHLVGRLALGIEPHADLGDLRHRLAHREVVQAEAQRRGPRRQQLADALGQQVPPLADAHADEVRPGRPFALGRRRAPQRGVPVVGDLDPGGVGRLELGRADVAGRVEALELDLRVPPLVLPVGQHVVGGRADDEVRRPAQHRLDLPGVGARELERLGQVGGVALGRAGVDPADHGVDLGRGQRDVVLVVLDAHRRVEVPGGHEAPLDPVADAARPGARLAVVEQRHRCDARRLVTLLARPLQDRRDVPAERGRRVARGLGAAALRRRAAGARQQ